MAPAYALVMALQGAFVVWPLAITATHCRVGEKGRQSDADQMKRMCRLWKRDSTDSVNILVQISPTPKQLSPRLAVSGTMMVGDQSRSLGTPTFGSSIGILTAARRLLKPASAAWRSGQSLGWQTTCWYLRMECLRAMWLSNAWSPRSPGNVSNVAEGCVYRTLCSSYSSLQWFHKNLSLASG